MKNNCKYGESCNYKHESKWNEVVSWGLVFAVGAFVGYLFTTLF